MMGFYWEAPEVDVNFYCWPDHWQAVQVFKTMYRTGWIRDGKGNREGMRYESLPGVMELMGIKKKHRHEIFMDLLEMEKKLLEIQGGTGK